MTPSYKTNDPKGWCGDPTRGAALGRRDILDAPADFAGKLVLNRIYLTGDYDSNGTYWGGGPGTLPLYWYADDDGQIDACLRAKDREDAKRQILEKYEKARFHETEWQLDEFVNGYIGAAFWSSNDESDETGGQPMDANYDASDLAASSLESIRRDCARFIEANKLDLELFVAALPRGSSDDGPWSLAGYCFWLNRNGHGTGFWDRGVGAIGDRLSTACEKFGPSDLCVGDDGEVYVSPER